MKPEPTTRRGRFYRFLITIPDRFYPFASFIEGERVRGMLSYEYTLAQVRELRGEGHYGYKLFVYREIFHFIGAVLFIVTTTFVSQVLFGSTTALLILLVVAILAISFQELYYHPRWYGQLMMKSIVDWMSWVVPIGLYLFLIARPYL